MKNLIVQLWGIGNLVNTQPLMAALGSGDVLIDPSRSTHELALLFPNWRFCGAGNVGIDNNYDDTYLCFPVDGRQFAPYTNRLHTPTWSFKKWQLPEWEVLAQMGTDAGTAFPPKLPRPEDSVSHPGCIAISMGYFKGDGGWAHKHWGTDHYVRAIREIVKAGFTPVLFGDQSDWDVEGSQVWQHIQDLEGKVQIHFTNPLWTQVKFLAGCEGYLGNDTGLGHIAGAYGLPSAIYTVADKVKVATAAPKLFQFGKDLPPGKAVQWLIDEIMAERMKNALKLRKTMA